MYYYPLYFIKKFHFIVFIKMWTNKYDSDRPTPLWENRQKVQEQKSQWKKNFEVSWNLWTLKNEGVSFKKKWRKAIEDVWEVKHALKRNNYTNPTLDSTSDWSLVVYLFAQVY